MVDNSGLFRGSLGLSHGWSFGGMKSMEKSFGDLEYEGKKQKTGREQLLERMDVLIPWGDRVGNRWRTV